MCEEEDEDDGDEEKELDLGWDMIPYLYNCLHNIDCPFTRPNIEYAPSCRLAS